MKFRLYQVLSSIKRALWAVIVAFMLGVHNFYKGEDKSLENIVAIELREEQEDGAPKDREIDYPTTEDQTG